MEDLARMEIVSRHVNQLDPKGDRHRTVLDDEMRSNATAWKDYEQGLANALRKKHVEAITRFTLAIDRYGIQRKTAGPVLMWRARSYRALKEPSKALKDYDAAIALDPNADNLYYSRAELHAELKQYGKALMDNDEAIRLSSFPVAKYHIKRGNVLRKLERPEHALVSYDKAIENARAVYDRLVSINRTMPGLKPGESEIFLKWAAKKRDGSIRRVEVQRGITLRGLKRYGEALSAFDMAISLQPDSAFAYKQRGWLYEKQDLLDLALADYKRALELEDASDWLNGAIKRLKSKVQ
jgi:tetratricopeptide (TPR) repeat protein